MVDLHYVINILAIVFSVFTADQFHFIYSEQNLKLWLRTIFTVVFATGQQHSLKFQFICCFYPPTSFSISLSCSLVCQVHAAIEYD